MTPCSAPVEGQSVVPTSSSEEGLGGLDLSLPSNYGRRVGSHAF